MYRRHLALIIMSVLLVVILVASIFTQITSSYGTLSDALISPRYIILSVGYSDGKTSFYEYLRNIASDLINYTITDNTKLIIENTNVVANGEVSIRYSGVISREYRSETIIDIRYTTDAINKTMLLYHVVLRRKLLSSNTSLVDVAESYILYSRVHAPLVMYNITGTNASIVYLLDAMIRKIILYPLLATDILEKREQGGGNTTIYGSAGTGNATLTANGEIHIVSASFTSGAPGVFTTLSIRITYNITALYGEPFFVIMRRIMVKGVDNYFGETGTEELLGAYIQGISPVMQRATAHVINDIVAESLVMNWTRLELVFDANNDSYVMGARYAAENASAADLPTVFLASNLAARGFRASSIMSLLSILHTLFNGSRVDPVAVLEKIRRVLGEPIYLLSPDIYEAPSKSVLETSAAINESSKEILGELEEILGIEKNITVAEHEVIIQPFPSLKEDVAVYMALKIISPTTITITSTGARTTTMPPQTTTKSPLLTTPPKTTTTKTLQSHTVAAPQKPAAPTQTMTATTPISREGSSGVTPLIIVLIPIIAFALLILILHIRAKKRVTEELIEELEETPSKIEQLGDIVDAMNKAITA